jgi:hypothetical protein
MFDQYTDEEIRDLMRTQEESSIEDTHNMIEELKCRKVAMILKDIKDEDLNNFWFKEEDGWYQFIRERAYLKDPATSLTYDQVSLEKFRREQKMIGLTEIPVKFTFTEKENEIMNYKMMGEENSEYYRKLLEEEKQSPNPDPEKIKKFEKQIATCLEDIEAGEKYFNKKHESMKKIKKGIENLEHYGELLENEKQMPRPNSKKIKEFEKQIIIWSQEIEEGREFFKE